MVERLARLGIKLFHTLKSKWLMQRSGLIEGPQRRTLRKVLDCGHVYTDDSALPLQNDDWSRGKTLETKLWSYTEETGMGRRSSCTSSAKAGQRTHR